MAEAGDVGVEIGQPAERGGCLGSVEVEHAEDHLAFVLRGDVPGDQHPMFGQVQGDAAIGVARRGDDVRAAAEVERVTVPHLAVDADRRCGRQSGGGPTASPRMTGVSAACATTCVAPQEATSAADPA